MRKIKNLVLGGIQQKVFNLVLFTVILMIAAYTGVILHHAARLSTLVDETNEAQKQSITAISDQTMDAVIASSMGNSTRMEAHIADDMFRDLRSDVQMLADCAAAVFASPDDYPPRSYALPDPASEGVTTVQLLLDSGIDTDDPALVSKLGLAANLSDMMKSMYDAGQINSCYIALPEGAMLLADAHAAQKFTADGSVMTIPMRERPWYTGAVEAGRAVFTDVVQDVFTGQIGIMCGAPVYSDGKLAAVVGADLFLDSMAQSVRAQNGKGSYTCIVNDRGHVIFSSRGVGAFAVRAPGDAADLRESDNAELASFIGDALSEATGVRQLNADGMSWYVSGAPIGTVGWAVVSMVSKDVTEQPTVMMQRQYEQILDASLVSFTAQMDHAKKMIVILLIIILILGLASALTLAKRIVKPLEAITSRVKSLGGNDLQFFMEDDYRTGDEIEVLAESFANLSARTLQYVDQVKRITAEKERIGAELSMATDIQASQLPRLFPAFPNRPEFDVYASMTPAKEVGGDFYDFFLVDDDHIGLVMADVSGKGVPAALFMMVSRVLIKSHLQNGETPGVALENVNDQLCEGNDAELFVTVWVAVLEISTGKGIAANAGHEHPTLRRANGQYELVTYRHSPAVATLEGIPYKEHTFELHPGDSFFVYTDGVAEATSADKELFGTERMLEALNRNPDASPEETLSNVMAGIDEFVAGAEQFDDITMLCLKYYGPAK